LISTTTLASGLRVITERMPDARSVCAGVWVGVGSRDEPAELAGVSHFLEHLLFKGTPRRSAKAIAQAVDRVGGDMNAFTTKEYTAYYTRLPADCVGLGLELLGDVVSDPLLAPADVDAERQVILEELLMDADLLDDRVHVLLGESLFPGHPLGRDTAGSPDTVAAVTAEDVRAFFERWYRSANMVVAVAGAVDHDDVVARVERAFSAPAGGEAPPRVPPGPKVRPVATVRRRSEQAHLAVGYRAVDRRHPDREALDVLSHVLGGGMSSRLFDEIREQRGLAYSVYSSTAAYADAGALMVYAGTSPGRVGAVLDLIEEQLDKVRAEGVTEAEMAVAQGYLVGSFLLGLEDSASRMSRLGGALTCLGEVRSVDEQVARYRAVSQEDVARVAARLLDAPRALAAVGPLARAQLLQRV